MRQGMQDIRGSLPEIHPELDPQSVEPREIGEETDSSHCIRVRGDIVQWDITHHVEKKAIPETGLIEIKELKEPIYTLKMDVATGLGYLPFNLRVGEELLSKILDGKKLKIEIIVEPVLQDTEEGEKK